MRGWSPFRTRESFDVVTARAVASLAVLVEYAAPLLRRGGQLVAWKGARDRGGGAGWGGGGPGRRPLARSRRGGRAVPRRALAPPALLRRRPRRRPTASPAAPAWRASARSPDRGKEVTVRCRTVTGCRRIPTASVTNFARVWERSTRSRTRRAGSARRPPPSTSAPASPRRATGRCSSTSTRSATPPSRSAWARTPSRTSTTA